MEFFLSSREGKNVKLEGRPLEKKKKLGEKRRVVALNLFRNGMTLLQDRGKTEVFTLQSITMAKL